MIVINDDVFIQKLESERKTIFIPKSTYNKIIYIESGKFVIQSNNNTLNGVKDDYIVLEKNECIKLEKEGSHADSGRLFVVYVRPEYIKSLSNDGCDLQSCFLDAKISKRVLVKASSEVYMLIKALTSRLISYEKIQGFGKNEILNSTLIILLAAANRGYIESRETKKRRHNALDLIDDIFIYINKHISEPISLDDLAEEFFVSKYHLSKVFKKATNMTIHSCILKRKLAYSKELIDKNIPVIEIYQQCGFVSYSHFFRAFKKEFGITPKQYYNNMYKG